MNPAAEQGTKYDQLLVSLFKKKWKPSLSEIPFSKDEVIDAAGALGLRIKNLADVIYTYRSRRPMPDKIRRTGNWVPSSPARGFLGSFAVRSPSCGEGFMRSIVSSLSPQRNSQRLLSLICAAISWSPKNNIQRKN
jgi:hypothetical protein